MFNRSHGPENSVVKIPIAAVDQRGQQRQERRVVHRVAEQGGVDAEVLAKGVCGLQLVGVDQLAVDEAAIADAQHAQPTQALQRFTLLQQLVDFPGLIRRLRRRQIQLVARLGDKLAEPVLEVFRLLHQIQHHLP